VFGLTAEEASKEFIDLTTNVLDVNGVEADARTAALGVHINDLLTRYGIEEDMHLMDPNDRSKGCKL